MGFIPWVLCRRQSERFHSRNPLAFPQAERMSQLRKSSLTASQPSLGFADLRLGRAPSARVVPRSDAPSREGCLAIAREAGGGGPISAIEALAEVRINSASDSCPTDSRAFTRGPNNPTERSVRGTGA